jgi:Protein of unknown function (DUF3016)
MKRLFTQAFGAFAVAAAVASAPAYAAGTVQVKFVEPDKFADVRGMHQRVDDGLLKILEAHFQSAASKHVPDGQTLNIEVLDVDLAGEFRPRFSASPDVRVLGLGADSPHITLRYALSSPSGAVQLAEVQLSDLGYLHRGTGRYGSSESLRFEKRMIDEWVKTTFASK